MSLSPRRLQREYKTIRAMIGLSCRDRHGRQKDLCPECQALLAYAKTRLDKCPYRERKPACGRCPIHCYKPAMRERIRDIMRYAGPRMIRRHPLLAFLHLLDGLKKTQKVKEI